MSSGRLTCCIALMLTVMILSGCGILIMPDGAIYISIERPETSSAPAATRTPVPTATTTPPAIDPTPTREVVRRDLACVPETFTQGVNLRAGAGTDYSVVGVLEAGTCEAVIDTATDGDGRVWYWLCKGGAWTPDYCISTPYVASWVVDLVNAP